MSLSQSSQLIIPNLPGFKSHEFKSGPKKKFFELVGGLSIMKYEEPQYSGPSLIEESSVLSIGSTSLMNKSKRLTSAEQVNVKLTFQAYYEEGENSRTEKIKIRKCIITYFLEDNSIQIVERPQINSGLQQGTLIKRSVIMKPDGQHYSPLDFHLGDELLIYGKRYRLVDCDQGTRTYIRKLQGVIESPSLNIPSDPYEETRPEMRSNEFSYEKFKYKKNANSKYQESALGIAVDNSGRAGFINYGNMKLNFLCIWDNTEMLYGDMMEFSLAYSLGDDSLEIFQVPSYNSGRDETFSRLLKKAKLPRSIGTHILSGDDPVESVYYKWTDLYIGMELPVYGRTLRIVDCDEATRAFYKANGYELGPSIKPPKIAPIEFTKRETPLVAGMTIGVESSEPKKRNGENRQITFTAKLLSGGPDDVDRRFVITFYDIDDTLIILEPPIRNSGFVGGTFLARMKIKKENGDYISETDFYIGCDIRILKHRFFILDADVGTLKYMDANSHKFTRSNFYHIIKKLRGFLFADALNGNLNQYFQEVEERVPGVVTKSGLMKVFRQYDILNNYDENLISEHEVHTLLFKTQDKNLLSKYSDIIQEIIESSGRFH